MKFQRDALLKTLNIVKPGLASKEVIEQSTSFIFRKGQVLTYNDEIAVHAPLPEKVELEGAIPAKEFLAILSRFKGEEVELDISENELLMKCGRSKAGIRLFSEITLPLDDLDIPDEWTALPEDFAEGVKAALPSAARDLKNPILTVLHFTPDFVEATDSDRISRYHWNSDNNTLAIEEGRFLLPYESASALSRLSVTDFCVTDGWIHFTNDTGVVFSCRTSHGDYPNLTDFLEFEPTGSFQFPDKMKEMLDRAGVFLSASTERDNAVHIEINEKGLMKVRGEGEFGWYEENTRIEWDSSDAITFSVHPSHLLSLLSGDRKVGISPDRICFKTDHFVHLVALEAI